MVLLWRVLIIDNMAISLSLPAKANVTLSKESKDMGLKWDDANWDWDSADSPWDAAKMTLSKTAKSNVSLSLESK